jgi:hypothetical protein
MLVLSTQAEMPESSLDCSFGTTEFAGIAVIRLASEPTQNVPFVQPRLVTYSENSWQLGEWQSSAPDFRCLSFTAVHSVQIYLLAACYFPPS